MVVLELVRGDLRGSLPACRSTQSSNQRHQVWPLLMFSHPTKNVSCDYSLEVFGIDPLSVASHPKQSPWISRSEFYLQHSDVVIFENCDQLIVRIFGFVKKF